MKHLLKPLSWEEAQKIIKDSKEAQEADLDKDYIPGYDDGEERKV